MTRGTSLTVHSEGFRMIHYYDRPVYRLTSSDISTVGRDGYSITSGWSGIIIRLDDRHPQTKEPSFLQIIITPYGEVLLSREDEEERWLDHYLPLAYFFVKRTATSVIIRGRYSSLTMVYRSSQLRVFLAPVTIPSAIAPVASAPVASAPVASAPVASAIAIAPVASAPVAIAPVASAPVAIAPVASAPVAIAPAPIPTGEEVWSCNGIHTMVEWAVDSRRNIIYPHGAKLNLSLSPAKYQLLLTILRESPQSRII